MGGNILNEINQRNRHKFDELFPPNYTLLGGILFNEAKQRNMRKFDEFFPPIYIFRDKLYMMNYFLTIILFWRSYVQ